MQTYRYRPTRFYALCFALTWGNWLLALLFGEGPLLLVFMVLGLFSPAAVATATVLCSNSPALKADFRRKLLGFYRLRPGQILLAVLSFAAVTAAAIAVSVLFGGSPEQFAFTEDFSFSIGGFSALLTITLASFAEELGWRGYGEDAVGAYHTWFTETLIFGTIWACWHLPLFWIPGSYQYGLRELGLPYVLNFLLGTIPFNFFQTWVYVANKRSMLATVILHLFVNVTQEKIAMTPETKCIQTLFVALAAVLIVLKNRELFFEREHVGNLLAEEDVTAR